MFDFILEFKNWFHEVFKEAYSGSQKEQSKIYKSLLAYIEDNANKDVLKLVDDLISDLNNLYRQSQEPKTPSVELIRNRRTFISAFFRCVLNRTFKDPKEEYGHFIPEDETLLLREKLPIAMEYSRMLLKDLKTHANVFLDVLLSQKIPVENMGQNNYEAALNFYFVNPRGELSEKHPLFPKNTLFKTLFKKNKSEKPQGTESLEKLTAGKLFGDDEEQVRLQPTEKESSPQAKLSGEKPKIELDDIERKKQQQFQRILLNVTPAEAKEYLIKELEASLDSKKEEIINPTNLNFYQSNILSKKTEINQTNNYLKVKGIYDIASKFDVKDPFEKKSKIAELEFHSDDLAAEGMNYSELPTKDFIADSEHGYFNKLSTAQIENEIKNYIIGHYNVDKNPKEVISFFKHIYNSSSWKDTVENAVKKAVSIKPDLLTKEFPLIQKEIEPDEVISQRNKTKQKWINLSGRFNASAKDDYEKFSGSYSGNPSVKEILDKHYYDKFYNSTSESLSDFQELIMLYRVFIGLSAIEIAKTKTSVDVLPICKQLQYWLESSYRDPEFGKASIQELSKIKDIKKIKSLLDKNKNVIEMIFKKGLNNICNNERFDEFELEDEEWSSQHQDYLATLQITKLPEMAGKSLSDVLELKNSKNPQDQKMFRDLLRKAKISLKEEERKNPLYEEEDLTDLAKKVIKFGGDKKFVDFRRVNDVDSEAVQNSDEYKNLLSKIVSSMKKMKTRPYAYTGSSLWQDIKMAKYAGSSPVRPEKETEKLLPGYREKEQFGVPYVSVPSPSSDIPKSQEWQPKKPEAPTAMSSPVTQDISSLSSLMKQRINKNKGQTL